MFSEIDGVKGESKDKTHAKQTDVLSWSWGMSNNGSADVGGVAGPTRSMCRTSGSPNMQRMECSCASIELAKSRVSSRMITTDKINHGLKIRRGKSLGLFTRSSLIGTWMRAGFFIAAIPISASAQTREQIAATQAQIAARQAQNNADPAISQRDPLQAQLDAISQRDALQAQLEDAPVAANRRDSLQNQPKTGEAGANPSQQEPQSATSEALPAPVPAPTAFTPAAALRPNARGRHGYKPRPPARPQPQPTFWQRLFGHKEPKTAKPGKPRP
jgi:hypothetical protein